VANRKRHYQAQSGFEDKAKRPTPDPVFREYSSELVLKTVNHLSCWDDDPNLDREERFGAFKRDVHGIVWAKVDATKKLYNPNRIVVMEFLFSD
jgi:hypothetical protein